jgi:hypothetical protein
MKRTRKPAESSVFDLADAAFHQATLKAIERAEQTGTPVILWENGQIKEADPKECRDQLLGRTSRRNLARS